MDKAFIRTVITTLLNEYDERGLDVEALAVSDDGVCTVYMTDEDADQNLLRSFSDDLLRIKGIDSVDVVWGYEASQLMYDAETFCHYTVH